MAGLPFGSLVLSVLSDDFTLGALCLNKSAGYMCQADYQFKRIHTNIDITYGFITIKSVLS